MGKKHYLNEGEKAALRRALIFGAAIVVIICAVVGYTFHRIDNPKTEADRFDQKAETVKIAAQSMAAVGAFLIVWFTWLRIRIGERTLEETQKSTKQAQKAHEENLKATREGQITERFTRAIEQLGSKEIAIRLGGIYSLERIARDSKNDHNTVMEVLRAFVLEERPESDEVSVLSTDIDAIIQVFARRKTEHEDLPGYGLDLGGLNLSQMNVVGAQFEKVLFIGTDFREAALTGGTMAGSCLMCANLKHATLYRVDLTGADLASADLTGAELPDANLTDAHLTDADLSAADLSAAKGLTQAQIDSAKGNSKTKLPPGLTRPDHWQE